MIRNPMFFQPLTQIRPIFLGTFCKKFPKPLNSFRHLKVKSHSQFDFFDLKYGEVFAELFSKIDPKKKLALSALKQSSKYAYPG